VVFTRCTATSLFDHLRPRGCVNGRHRSVRRAPSGWPTLFHLGRDAWCLRFSAIDLRRIRPMACVPAHRPFFRPTSPLVGASCRCSFEFRALRPVVECDMPSWGSFPLRCLCVQASFHRSSHPATSVEVSIPCLGPVLRSGCPDVAIRSASTVKPSSCEAGSFHHAARPGFVGCPHALFAPCLHTCRACLIPTASLGFIPSEV